MHDNKFIGINEKGSENRMRYAIDFGILNRNEFIVDEKGKQIKELDLKKEDIVLVEIGCPKGKLYQYAEKCKVLLIDGKETDKARKGKKTHKEDALTILRLHNEKPKLFKKLNVKDKEELERIKQFKIYMWVTKTLAGIKNIQKAHQREYGEELKVINKQIKELEKNKKALLKPLEKWIKPQLEQVDDIKGLGPRYLIEILLFANPKKFPCLSAYLKYCGFKGVCKETHKFNRNVKSAYYMVVDGIIKHREMDKGETDCCLKTSVDINSPNQKEETGAILKTNGGINSSKVGEGTKLVIKTIPILNPPQTFGSMYDEFKKNIGDKNPDWTKGKINGVTINRIATFVAKEVYKRFGNQ